VAVRLFEMRPGKMTEAHETGDVAELVCSNSLKSDSPENAHGLLKAELRVLGSVLMECAERARIPGGKALVVDRKRFSDEVRRALDEADVEVIRQEVIEVPASVIPSAARSAESRNLAGETPRIAPLPRGDKGGVVALLPRGDRKEEAEDWDSPSRPESGERATQTRKTRNGPDANITVVATGPLTSQAMADALQTLLGADRLFFYDAIAPIVSAESLDMNRIFEGSRYGAGSDYLNCPMTEEEYDRFVSALLEAELNPLHAFEKAEAGCPQIPQITQMAGQQPRTPQQEPETRNEEPRTFFEGCLPVEEIARRGRLALAFGPMKPVGLVDPRPQNPEGWPRRHEGHETDRTGNPQITQTTRSVAPTPREGSRPAQDRDLEHNPDSSTELSYVPRPKRPFAVVQLRRENAEGTMYNLVGFQTRLKQGEQERVFRMIPGLEKACFLRFGSIHRNTYIDSPHVLLPTLQSRARRDLLVAGQLTGVEGYVESIGAGLVAGINAARLAEGDEPLELPRDMMLGSLLAYIAAAGHERKGTEGSRDQGIECRTHQTEDAISTSKFRMTNEGQRVRSGGAENVFRFQPMNANFGLLPQLEKRLRGRDRRRALAERALTAAREFALTLAGKRA